MSNTEEPETPDQTTAEKHRQAERRLLDTIYARTADVGLPEQAQTVLLLAQALRALRGQ